MKILALDTSTPTASLALAEGESGREFSILAEKKQTVSRSHSISLLPDVDELVRSAGLTIRDVDLFASGLGPGSFTGLRIGLAAAKGLAWAAEKPLIGVPTLDALAGAYKGEPGLIRPVVDARKNQVYSAAYRINPDKILERLTDYIAYSPADLAAEITEETVFFGTGLKACDKILAETIGAQFIRGPLELDNVSAAVLAELAMERYHQNEPSDPIAITPLYVRPPDIRS